MNILRDKEGRFVKVLSTGEIVKNKPRKYKKKKVIKKKIKKAVKKKVKKNKKRRVYPVPTGYKYIIYRRECKNNLQQKNTEELFKKRKMSQIIIDVIEEILFERGSASKQVSKLQEGDW